MFGISLSKGNKMKTYKLKEAIQVLAHGGFIREPKYYFSKHTSLFNKHGALVGYITYDCYFDICETLGYAHHDGLLKSGKRTEYIPKEFDAVNWSWEYSTISGDLTLCKKMEDVNVNYSNC
jgi:hypothetical protein